MTKKTEELIEHIWPLARRVNAQTPWHISLSLSTNPEDEAETLWFSLHRTTDNTRIHLSRGDISLLPIFDLIQEEKESFESQRAEKIEALTFLLTDLLSSESRDTSINLADWSEVE